MSLTFSSLFRELVTRLHPAPAISSMPSPDGESLLVLTPKDYEIQQIKGPTAPVPNHTLHDLRDFASYLHARADAEKTDVLVDARHAVADFGPHAEGAPRITCALVAHPIWAMWRQRLGTALSTEELFDFIRTVAETLPPPAEGQPSQAAVLLAGLSKFEIVSTGEYKTEIDGRGALTFQGKTEKTAVSGAVPTELRLRLPLFAEIFRPTELGALVEADYDLPILVKLKIRKKGDGKEAVWTLSAPTRPLVEAQALRDVVAYLRRLLGDGWLVSMGVANSTTTRLPLANRFWDTLPPAPPPEEPPPAA